MVLFQGAGKEHEAQTAGELQRLLEAERAAEERRREEERRKQVRCAALCCAAQRCATALLCGAEAGPGGGCRRPGALPQAWGRDVRKAKPSKSRSKRADMLSQHPICLALF